MALTLPIGPLHVATRAKGSSHLQDIQTTSLAPARVTAERLPLQRLSISKAASAVFVAVCLQRAHRQRKRTANTLLARFRSICFATKVETKSKTDLAPWEIEEETEEERQERYTREAEEMKLKWDARRLEERQSAQRRQAFSQKEQERASLYGPRDPIMEAYEARMYEEARVIEVRRKQREVYERTKASHEGRPLPPKGKPFVVLKPLPVEPPKPEEFDISGHYKPEEDIEARKYKAPSSYVSPTGPAPPPRHLRGAPRAAWENPPYGPAPVGARPSNYPEPGSLPAKTVPPVRERIEKERAERKSRRRRKTDEEKEEEGEEEEEGGDAEKDKP